MNVRLKAAALTAGLLAGLVPGLVSAGEATAAPLHPTKTTVRASHPTIGYGTKLAIVAQVAGAPVHSLARFYETDAGRPGRLIYNGYTDAHGYVSIIGTPAYNAVYTVRFFGDATHAASQAAVRVAIVAKVVTSATGGRKSGNYRIYQAGSKAYLAAAVGPSKTGEKVYFPLQVRTSSGGWKTVLDHGYALDNHSVVSIYYMGGAGHTYRIRAEYHGDSLDHAKNSAWIYSRFSS